MLLSRARRAPVRACSSPTTSTATSGGCTRRTVPSSTAPGSGIATCFARERAERVATDSRPGEGRPVFAYGFEDLTGAEWRLLEALAGRTDVTVSLPYEPGRPAFAAVQATAEDLARLADGRIEELPPRFDEVAHPALAHLERALFADAPPAPVADRRRRPLPRGRGHPRRARAGRPTRSSTRARRRGGRGDRRRLPVARPLARRRSRRASARRRPLRARGRGRASPRRRFGAALCSLLRFAWLGGDRARAVRASSARRTPACRATRSTSPKGACADARSPSPSASRRRSSKLAAGRAARRELAALGARPGGGRPRARCGAMSARRSSGRRACRDRGARRDLRALRGRPPAARRARAAGRRSAASCPARKSSRRSSDASVPGARAGEPGRVAVLDLARARTRRFEVVFVLGLEEGGLPRRERESPFLDDDDAPPPRGPARSAPEAVEPRPLSLLHRLRARDAGASTSCARRRPTRARRARRARSGTTSGPSSRRRRRPLDLPAAAVRAHAAAGGGEDRARAAARAGAAGRERAGRGGRARARERLGPAARPGARRVHAAHAADAPARARVARRARLVRRHRARAVRRLLVRVVRRALPRPEVDRRRGRPEAERRRRAHRRCTASSPGCRRSSAPTASSRSGSRTRVRFMRRCLDDALARRAAWT